MTFINPGNERLKRRYVVYLEELRGLSETSIEQALNSIKRFEQVTRATPFQDIGPAHAREFRKRLLQQGSSAAHESSIRLSANAVLTNLRQFFIWLKAQPGLRQTMKGFDPDYFSLSLEDARIARTRFERPSHSIDELRRVILAMPSDSEVQKRNRAMMALLLLTGTRVTALASLKLKHVRRDGLGIDQDAREVKTKFRKSFPTFYFPVGDDIKAIFVDYVTFLRSDLGFHLDDPLFPSTRQGVRAHTIEVLGLTREHWKTADTVRDVFKRAFAALGLPCYGPHSVRRTLALLGQETCTTPASFKAWSQNLGHEGVLTTFASYGTLPATKQAELLRTSSRVEAPQELTANETQRLKQLLAGLSDPI